MPLPIPKPPGPNGNPPPYDPKGDLAERCAKAEKERDDLRGQLDAMAAVVRSAYVHKDEVRKLVDALRMAELYVETEGSDEERSLLCKAFAHANSLSL